MNKLILSVFVLFAGVSMNAQNSEVMMNTELIPSIQETVEDTSWKSGGIFGINFGQAALKNWAAGGQNSVSFGAVFSMFKNYKKGKHSWDNNLDLALGALQQGDAEFIKTDDKFDFSSKYGRQLKKEHWYLSGLVNFKTQFLDGYADPLADTLVSISKILAPGYALASLGLDYKPNDKFSVYISPLTAKFTIVNDDVLADAGAFGVTGAVYDELGVKTTDGENFRSEFGAYLKAVYQDGEIFKNVGLVSKLDLFGNYENMTQIDVAWENLISMKVNKYVSATIGTTLLYDHDVKVATDVESAPVHAIQFKEVLNIGFSYKF